MNDPNQPDDYCPHLKTTCPVFATLCEETNHCAIEELNTAGYATFNTDQLILALKTLRDGMNILNLAALLPGKPL